MIRVSHSSVSAFFRAQALLAGDAREGKERVMRAKELEKDRATRMEEREAHERMELENFKLILEVLCTERK